MSRPEFESIVAGAPRESLKRNLITVNTGSIARFGFVDYNVFSPAGTISRLNSIAFEFTPSPLGTSNIDFFYTNGNRAFITMSSTSGYIFNNNWWQSAVPGTLNPSNIDTLLATMRNVFFDATTGIRIRWTNQGAGAASASGSIEIYTIETLISI